MADPDFTTLSRALDHYCPFEALGVARQEIRHSNFLADILDPLRPHGFGDSFLKAFLDVLLAASGLDVRRLDLHLSDLSQADIRREWQNIDLLCVIDHLPRPLVAAIEIKVESGEHGTQLAEYVKKIEAHWPNAEHCYVFLTPTGQDSSDDRWTAISFASVLDGIEPLLRDIRGEDAAKMMLGAYITMMRRRYVPNDEMENLARRIWEKHGAALEYLMDQRPDLMSEISTAIQEREFASIAKQIKQATGIEIALDHCSNTFMRIAVPTWDDCPDMLCASWTKSRRILLCEVEFYGQRVHIRMQLGPGDPEPRTRMFQKLNDTADVDSGKKAKPTAFFSRLAAKTLLSAKEIEKAADSDTLILASRDGIAKFLEAHLPSYHRVLMEG